MSKDGRDGEVSRDKMNYGNEVGIVREEDGKQERLKVKGVGGAGYREIFRVKT